MNTIVERSFKIAPLIGERFKLLEGHIGKGSFGYVYKAVDTLVNNNVAVKFEKKSAAHHLLEYEYKILSLLKDYPAFPRVYWFGDFEDYVVMVMQLFGVNMEEVLNHNKNPIPMRTVFQIGYQVICCLQVLHEQGFVFE
jgi:casein kinase I family protein HRR25